MKCKDRLETDYKLDYLLYYDLSKPGHETLLQRFPIGPTKDVFSVRMAHFGEEGYLYVMTNDEVASMQVNPYYSVYIPDEQLPMFSQFTNVTFQVKPDRQYGINQLINLHFVKTGYMLETIQDQILIRAGGEDKNITVNLDQFFTGYRSDVRITYSENYKNASFSSPLDDSSLLTQTKAIELVDKYEFASVQEGNQNQKGLIYLGENGYAYVDCTNVIFLEIVHDVLKVIDRQPHGVPNIISKVRYWPEFKFNPLTEPFTFGTLVIQYSMNGKDDLIQF